MPLRFAFNALFIAAFARRCGATGSGLSGWCSIRVLFTVAIWRVNRLVAIVTTGVVATAGLGNEGAAGERCTLDMLNVLTGAAVTTGPGTGTVAVVGLLWRIDPRPREPRVPGAGA